MLDKTHLDDSLGSLVSFCPFRSWMTTWRLSWGIAIRPGRTNMERVEAGLELRSLGLKTEEMRVTEIQCRYKGDDQLGSES